MASTQHEFPVPDCLELRDERAPRRLRALRALVGLSLLGWLAFAAVLSVTSADPVPADLSVNLAMGDAQDDLPLPLPAAPPPLRPADEGRVILTAHVVGHR